jgi:putative transposase
MEVVEIDHTLLDLVVVDDNDRLPIGRPTITFALDHYSGFPVGLYCGFEPPNYNSVMYCLLHAILPKPDARELYGTKNTWIAYGKMDKLNVDNGPEFLGHNLSYACARLGILLEQLPVKKPWFKASIERFFQSHNSGLVHTLPGTTFSNVLERGDINPFQQACISLSGFKKLMHVFLLDYYAQQWHEGKNYTPARRWEESLQAGYVPALDHSAEEVRILLYPGEKRVPGRSGIEFEVMHYQSEELKALRSVLPKGTEVTVKYDPEDISILYVYDEYIKKKWIKAYAIDQEYTRALSLWKHRIIRKNVLRQKGEVDIEALAEAKARIQQIVEDEYMMTKKSRGRKRAARYLNNGAETSSESASNKSQANTTVKIPEAAEPDDAQADTLGSVDI